MLYSLFRLYFSEIAYNFFMMILAECLAAYYNFIIGDLIKYLK